MIRNVMKRCAAVAVLVGLLVTAGVVDAAPRRKAANAGGAVSGMVIHARGNRGVGRARVKVARHHHKHKHKKHVKGAHKAHAAHAGHHKARGASVLTGPRGHFSLRNVGGGAVTLVAHKRGAGTGHARVAAGGNVTIRLHKHHHAHSGAITRHARHKVRVRIAHKNAPRTKGPVVGPVVPQKKNGK